MKKVIVLAPAFLLCLFSAAYASNLEIGSETSYIRYKEPEVMREKGVMNGITGSYSYHNKIMLKAEGKGSWGSVDYRNSGAVNNISDYLLELRGLCGYDLKPSEKHTLTPYLGFGYRYLNDDMAGTVSSKGTKGYKRESNYFYIPAGLEATADLKNNWSVGITGEYDIFLWGIQKSHLSDVPGYTDASNDQKNGYGLRSSVKLQKKLRKVDLVIEPFMRYWNIKKSKGTNGSYLGVPNTVWEPKNYSKEIGCKLAVRF